MSTSVSPRKAASSQHLVKDRAHAEDVAAVVDWLAPQLLGRHVGHGADYRAALGNRGQFFHGAFGFSRRGLQFRDSKVENLDSVVGGYKQIFRLEITMNDTALVCRDETLHDLQRVVDRQADRQCPFCEPFAESLAFQQFTNDVGRTLVETNVVNGDNVGMI